MAKKWAKFPHANTAFMYDTAAIKKHWERLHRGDTEPFPANSQVLDAWRFHHAGDFQQAVALGRTAGASGNKVAVKAQTVHATYLEKHEPTKLALLEQAFGWADEYRRSAPKDANAHYLYAFALGRYGQHISVAKALAQGYGGKIKDALTTALKLAPKHAEAHTAFGAYQSEVIDKVGALVAGMTYGAKKDSALEHFREALELFPESPIAHIEYANGLLRLFGKARIDEAAKLYDKAAKAKPMDAMERLDIEVAKSELE
jgi:tetratricopeptide (TPR) repeat protein